MKLVLFDIDHTLLENIQAHGKAFTAGFKEVYDIDTDLSVINPHGMTDQQIIYEVLKKNGLTENNIEEKINQCMKFMEDSFSEIIKSQPVMVLDGVNELFYNISKKDYIIGIVTGNLKSIAKTKLESAGLWKYISVGGYGSDGFERTKLVKLAIKRAENCGFKSNDNIYLFGDTPKDISAGMEAGVITVGIATGIYSKSQLRKADYILDNLQNTEKILNIIDSHKP